MDVNELETGAKELRLPCWGINVEVAVSGTLVDNKIRLLLGSLNGSDVLSDSAEMVFPIVLLELIRWRI